MQPMGYHRPRTSEFIEIFLEVGTYPLRRSGAIHDMELHILGQNHIRNELAYRAAWKYPAHSYLNF